jgi:DNA-binding IclR family transcriptional regulator
METASEEVTSMIFMSKWSSQTLCAGAELGLFDFLSRDRMRTATDVAAETGLDPALLYRLLRALASIGLLNEMPGRGSARAMGGRHGLGLRVVTRHGSDGASPSVRSASRRTKKPSRRLVHHYVRSVTLVADSSFRIELAN